MSSGLVIAIAVPVVAGVFALLNTILSRRMSRAEEEVAGSTAQVDTALKAMDGMERLADQRLAENERLEKRVEELEHELVRERASNAVLTRLLRMKQEEEQDGG